MREEAMTLQLSVICRVTNECADEPPPPLYRVSYVTTATRMRTFCVYVFVCALAASPLRVLRMFDCPLLLGMCFTLGWFGARLRGPLEPLRVVCSSYSYPRACVVEAVL